MSEIKYKLLKELPFCEVGTISFTDNIGQIVFNNTTDDQYYFEKENIPKLIEQGWIKEYKPKSQKELANELLNNYSEKYSSLTEEKQFEWIKEFCDKYEIKEKE